MLSNSRLNDANNFITAYKEGQLACQIGVPEDLNPYVPQTREHIWWTFGYYDKLDELYEISY